MSTTLITIGFAVVVVWSARSYGRTVGFAFAINWLLIAWAIWLGRVLESRAGAWDGISYRFPASYYAMRPFEKGGRIYDYLGASDHIRCDPCGHVVASSLRLMDSTYLDFVRVVVDGDIEQLTRRLTARPALATTSSDVGASRQQSSAFFFADIAHHFYAGDTALHMAAAAFRRQVAALLVAHGADCRSKNRRGAEPLHYAADANRWDPTRQAETIGYLISAGADPNAVDRSGVSPLHRAVRTRSLPAVSALLDGGANPRQPNKTGSTPLHLAVQTTGRGGSGSPHAREQQAGIVRLLLQRGARVTDRDGQGKDVHQAATSEWIRVLLREASTG